MYLPYLIVLLLENRYRYSSNGMCLWSMSYLRIIIYAEFRKIKKHDSPDTVGGWEYFSVEFDRK